MQLFVAFTWLRCVGEAKLVAAAVLPHGDFAFDPSLLKHINPEGYRLSQGLHAGSLEAGRRIALAEPDVVILTTPHGLQTTWNIGIYQNAELDGRAVVGRDLAESFGKPFPTYRVELGGRTDTALAQQISDTLEARRRNVTLLRGWNGVLPLPLHWGEVLALEYLATASGAAARGGPPRQLGPSLVALGLPLSRYNLSSAVAAGFRAMGRDLGGLIESLEARVAVVVSTDLAHRHWPNTSFGFSPHAEPFDAAVGRWAASLDPTPLVVDSAAHVDEIYACGWLGLLLLHGALEGAAAARGGRDDGDGASAGAGAPLNATFTPTVTAAPAHPTYYGMMASFVARVRGS